MKTRRLGHVYCPTGEWTHASTPTAWHVGADTWRVFYASRDTQNRGHIFSLDLDMRRPTEPFNIQGPLISPGAKGTFDDCGLSPACIDGDRLYYLGWNLCKNAPFMNTIGSCKLDGGRLKRDRKAPILDRDEIDPVSLAYPFVVGNSLFYSSNLAWGDTDSDMCYSIKLARRWSDGWNRQGLVMLSPKGGETALVRPSVLNDGNRWSMFFAAKSTKYKIGYAYAYSSDFPRTFDRGDCEFEDYPYDWDSEEQTYPCAFAHKDKIYMLYNGNGYGRTGFGIAIIE